MNATADRAAGTRTIPVLPTDSLLLRFLGDRRFALTLPRALTLQILHPAVAAGLDQHVNVRLWAHKRRTVNAIVQIAYSERDLRSLIRYGHEHVKGRDDEGHRYHALNPELFFFQHATFVDTLFTAVNTFMHRLTPAEHEQLYRECVDWYARYGISTRHVPATWPEFQEYFEDACATQLRLTPAGERLAPEALRPDMWVPRLLPDFAVRALLHERARELLDVRVHPGDRLLLRGYASMVKASMDAAPASIRYLHPARTARKGVPGASPGTTAQKMPVSAAAEPTASPD